MVSADAWEKDTQGGTSLLSAALWMSIAPALKSNLHPEGPDAAIIRSKGQPSAKFDEFKNVPKSESHK